MATTYDKIATTTLGSTSSTITFSSIAGTYTDLRFVLAATTTAGLDLNTTFNGDTATNYSFVRLQGNGSVISSTSSASQNYIRSNYFSYVASQPYLLTMDLFSYAGSTFKTCLIENSEERNANGAVARQIALWRSTSAITSITFTTSSSTFAVGTTATLYGILKA